jgi:hypothetical protein
MYKIGQKITKKIINKKQQETKQTNIQIRKTRIEMAQQKFRHS